MTTPPPAKRARVTLDEAKAWQIATHVIELLDGEGRVRLGKGEQFKRRHVQAYEWVDIIVPHYLSACELLEWSLRVREACIVLHMLACYPGFGGQENELFWKRVIDAIGGDNIGDKLPFFPDKTFPRFRLVFIDHHHEVIKTLMHAFDGRSDEATTSSSASETVAFLRPLMCVEHAFDVGVCVSRPVPLRGLADIVENLMQVIESSPAFPRVRFTEVMIISQTYFPKSTDLAGLAQLLTRCAVDVPYVGMAPRQDSVADDALFACLSALSTGAARVQTLEVNLDAASLRQIAMVMSSLSTIKIQKFGMCQRRDKTLQYGGVKWLAYALYSPCAPHFQHLDLRVSDLFYFGPLAAAPALNAGAAHALLYRFVHGVDDQSEVVADGQNVQYAFVQVDADTRCFAERAIEGEIVAVIDAETTLMAVIETAVRNWDALPDSVCVVVPCRGHCWIPKTRITALWHQPPAVVPPIRGLTLGHTSRMASTLTMLAPFLQDIECLDVRPCRRLSPPEVLDLLRRCPTVKQLQLCHCGEVFNQWGHDMDEDFRVIELEALTLDSPNTFHAPSPVAWRTILRGVSDLRVVVEIRPFEPGFRATPPDLLQAAVRDAFQHGCHVERFVWTLSTGHHDQPAYDYGDHDELTYDEKRDKTREVLGMTDARFDMAHRPLSREARVAFASVIRSKHVDDATKFTRYLRHLSDEIAQLICSFAGTGVKRVVWFEKK